MSMIDEVCLMCNKPNGLAGGSGPCIDCIKLKQEFSKCKLINTGSNCDHVHDDRFIRYSHYNCCWHSICEKCGIWVKVNIETLSL